jgi:peptide deformylase
MTKLKGKAKDRLRKKQKNKSKNDFFIRKKNLLSEIRKFNDPILEVECEEASVEDKGLIKETFRKMMSVLNATENGVGLAAPQIGITKRLAIIKPDSKSRDITCMINPEVVKDSGEMKYGREGCLSYPDTYGLVERYTSVTVSYLDKDWKQQEKEYKSGDILGIVVQHELEHLDGGNCQIHDWWENPDIMEKIVQGKMNPPELAPNRVVESEDLKKEKALKVTKEALERNDFVDAPNEETTEAIDEAIKGELESFNTVEELFEDLQK